MKRLLLTTTAAFGLFATGAQAFQAAPLTARLAHGPAKGQMRDYIIGGALVVVGLVAFASTAFLASTPKVKLDHVAFGSGVLTPKHVIDWRFAEASKDWR